MTIMYPAFSQILIIAYFILFYVLQHNNDNLYPAISQILIIAYFILFYVLEHNNDNLYPAISQNPGNCLLYPFLCFIAQYLHFSKTSLDEPLDVHLCTYFHEQHCVTRHDVIQT